MARKDEAVVELAPVDPLVARKDEVLVANTQRTTQESVVVRERTALTQKTSQEHILDELKKLQFKPQIKKQVEAFTLRVTELSKNTKYHPELAKAIRDTAAMLTSPSKPALATYKKATDAMQGNPSPKMRALGLLMTAIAAAVAAMSGFGLVAVGAGAFAAGGATLFATRATGLSKVAKDLVAAEEAARNTPRAR